MCVFVVGFVTTTRITHATPSALYAHTASRKWECEDRMPAQATDHCKDIARQLVEDLPGRNIRVSKPIQNYFIMIGD